MKISVNCNWEKSDKRTFEDHYYYLNSQEEDLDFCIDFYPIIFSNAAKRYPREKRGIAFGEPSLFFEYSPEFLKKLSDFYGGSILSWHKQTAHLEQSKHYVFGTTTIGSSYSVSQKKFGISAVFSGKSDQKFEGYKIRREIEALENDYSVPTMVYNPKGKWLGSLFDYPIKTKEPSFDYAFHWAIENHSEEGYFTEKLIDCFITETVPIYYGDHLICERFNPKGIISFDRNNIASQVNVLSMKDYESRREAIKENKEIAKKYVDIFKNILLTLLGRSI